MGISDLISNLKKHSNTIENIVSLNVFRNKSIGVDVSIIMYRFLTQSQIAELFHNGTMLNPYIESYLNNFYLFALKYDITLIFVFDSKNQKARMIRDKCQEELNNGFESSHNKKASVYRRDDVVASFQMWATNNNIKCIVTVDETDAQLVELENAGITSCSFTIDTDLIPLGSQVIMTHISTDNETCHVMYGTHIRQLITNQINPNSSNSNNVTNRDHIIVYCVLLGCDYFPGILSIGPVKLKKYIEKWIQSTDFSKERDNILKTLIRIHIQAIFKNQEVSQSNTNSNRRKEYITDEKLIYYQFYNTVYHHFKHPKVWKFKNNALDQPYLGYLSIDEALFDIQSFPVSINLCII